MLIRPYCVNDLESVIDCFCQSVREIGARYYDPAQVAAWSAASRETQGWASRLSTRGVFVAELDGRVAGFIRVEDTGWVDLLYVHPRYERRGIARQLLKAACAWAVSHGARRFEANVSLAARPFFEVMGFHVVTEQCIERAGVTLANYRMSRHADSATCSGLDHQ